MDISKLPRLSKTEQATDQPPAGDGAAAPLPPVAAPAPAVTWCRQCHGPSPIGSRFCSHCGAPLDGAVGYASPGVGGAAGVGAEVWVSAVLGIIMILLGRSFGGWMMATMTGKPYDTGVVWSPGAPLEGQPVEYWQLVGFTALSDSAIFLFGVALLLEAVVLFAAYTSFRRKTLLIGFALFVTTAATLYNLYVSFRMFSAGLLPLMSLLAVAFGGYLAVFEWQLLQRFRVTEAQAARK